jgi:hypothetical protein
MSDCPHDYAEKDTALADSLCPLCMQQTIASQAADIEWLTAKRDELRALIASQAADIAALKALLQSAYARSSIEEGSPLSIKINAALRGDTDHDHR